MKSILVAACVLLPVVALHAKEVKGEYTGTVFASVINDNHVNIRARPDLTAKVLFQLNKDSAVRVMGVSENPQTVQNQKAYWLLISTPAQDANSSQRKGWVYAAFVKDCGGLSPSALSVGKYTPPTSSRGDSLDIILDRGGARSTFRVSPNKLDTQPFFTFTWSNDDGDFKYTDVPGSYAWYPETNEVEHISYGGTSMESAWVCFTDDFKYMLEDFGTSPGPRGLGVWTVAEDRSVFSGTYYRSLEMKGHEIDIVSEYTDWRISDGQIDAETARYAKDFKRKHPMPDQRSDGLSNTLIVRYRLDLDSNRRQFLGCEWIITQ